MMKFHPFADIFPLIEGDELAALTEDIRVYGQREAIWLHDGKILDGRNRWLACKEIGVEAKSREYKGDDPLAFVISLNLKRRHLKTGQRAAIAYGLATFKHGGDRKSDQGAKTRLDTITQDEAAALLNVGTRAVQDIAALAKIDPYIVEEIKSGAKTIPQAKRDTKKKSVKKKLRDISKAHVKKPTGEYDCIVVDPPWPIQKIERDVRPNQTGLDYPTMTVEDIAQIKMPAANDCHLWLWTTHRFLPSAFSILDSWRFKYVCCFVWHKPGGFQPVDLPQFNCEFALYARKGSPIFLDTKALSVCFDAPRGKHSEKPAAFYDVVRRVTGGRRLDMFNRRKIEGFDSWGQEAQ